MNILFSFSDSCRKVLEVNIITLKFFMKEVNTLVYHIEKQFSLKMSSDIVIFGQKIKIVGSEDRIMLQEVDKGKNFAKTSIDIFSVS